MARQYHERALLLLRQGRPRNAVEELHEGLREAPDDAYLHSLLAISYSRVERPEDALREAQEAVGLAPDFAYAYYAHAAVLLALGRTDDAEAPAWEAVRLDPNHPAYHAMLATTFLRRQRWAEALEAADRGLAVRPDHVECANDRAIALLNLGRMAEAVRTLRGALSHDPESSETQANLGWALLRRREPGRALEHLREALRLDPRNDWARDRMMEAIQARSPFRAWVHARLLSVSRFPPELSWSLLGGSAVFLGLAVADGTADEFTFVFAAVMALFGLCVVFLSHIVRPLMDLLLLLDPVGREVLARPQRVGALLMSAGLLLAGVSWVALAVSLFSFGDLGIPLTAALSTTGLLVPLGTTLRMPDGRARTAMEALTAFLYTCAVLLVSIAGYPGSEGWYGALSAVIVAGILVSMTMAGLSSGRAP